MADRESLERNLRLHLGSAGVEAADELPGAVRRTLTPRTVPPMPVRAAQRVAVKLGRLEWERAWLRPLMQARRAVLGDAASGPPRFLVRVDEYPYYTSYDRPQDLAMSARFHETMADAGLTHLMAVVPQLTHEPLVPGSTGGRALGEGEIAQLERMRADGVTFAQHGTTHRTRHASPRRRSELCGLSRADTAALLEEGRQRLLEAGIGETRAFVPPFNRFDAAQYELLAERFTVICGGPESVALLGFHGGPLWRGDAVYLPCYAPLYGDAASILPVVEELIELAPGTWVPIVLHTSWEQEDDFAALARLAARVAPYAESWDGLLADLDASREG